MSSKNIVIVTTNFANGGTERRASVLANEFVKKGYTVTYLVINKIFPDVVYKLDDKITLVGISDFMESHISKKEKQQAEKWKNKKLKYLSKIHSIAKLFGINDIMVKRQRNILAKSEYIRAFALCNPGAIYICFGIDIYERVCNAVKGLNCKIVFSDINAPQADGENVDERSFKILRKADACVFQTFDQKDCYSGYLPDNSVIIRNPITSQLPEMFDGERKSKIVNFCRIASQKNLILLADAFKLFLADYPDYILEIYGITSTESARAYKEKLLKHIEDLGIQDRMFIYNAVSDIHQKICDSKIYVSSSDYEGLSNSMIEAMAMGLPCVCTDCLGGGAREMIKDGENGLLVPVKDADAMYRAMCRMVQEEGLAQRCSENAYKVRTELSVENIVNQWINAIESL